MALTSRDRAEFRAFCQNATDRQLPNIYRKERDAAHDHDDEDRAEYAQIAKEEMEQRGLSFEGYGSGGEGGRQTIHDFLRQNPVDIRCEQVDHNPNMVGGHDMDHWRCRLRGPLGGYVTVYFSMGSGHHGKEPTAADVVNSMVSDVQMMESARGQDDLARDLGMELYIEDPRTGREKKNPEIAKLWKAIEKEKGQLQEMFGGGTYDLLNETEPL